jgi:hypothetical protein
MTVSGLGWRRLLGGLTLVLPLFLAACDTPPRANRFPQITFAQHQPIRLAVREIAVEEAYESPGSDPYIEHQLPIAPAGLAARWGRERLEPAGPQNILNYVVREASVKEVRLERSGGVKGLLTLEQSERYEALIAVELQIVGETGGELARARAQSMRSITVPENATLHEREKVWFTLIEDILRDLDAQLERTIRESLHTFVVS